MEIRRGHILAVAQEFTTEAQRHGGACNQRLVKSPELDLLLERDGERFGVEVKTARASSPYLGRSLVKIAADVEARTTTVIDQAPGVEALEPGIERRGFGACLDWLPGQERV